jgi:hypothetical protein
LIEKTTNNRPAKKSYQKIKHQSIAGKPIIELIQPEGEFLES